MNSILLCEGYTDYVLLQYFMRKAYGWIDDKGRQGNVFKYGKQNKVRNLYKEENVLTICSVGGCGNLCGALAQVLQRNRLSPPSGEDFFGTIIMVTDRDETESEDNFFGSVKKEFQNVDVQSDSPLINNKWAEYSMVLDVGMKKDFRFLALVIPFEKQGAMETFLLDAIAEKDPYDAQIIKGCRDFVNRIDVEKRYLNKRRLMTKAEYNTYFCIRTPAADYNQRQDILQGIPWENIRNSRKTWSGCGRFSIPIQ